jgi:hypothetical protein
MTLPHDAGPDASHHAVPTHRVEWWRSRSTWAAILRGYLPFVAFGHFAWEIAQLPLYTIWTAGTPREIAFAVAHCTAGDILIAIVSLALALIVTRSSEFLEWNLVAVGALTLALGLAYTVVSEHVNLALAYWAYTAAMPQLPFLEVGLAPFAQWIVIPLAAFAWLKRLQCGRLQRVARSA